MKAKDKQDGNQAKASIIDEADYDLASISLASEPQVQRIHNYINLPKIKPVTNTRVNQEFDNRVLVIGGGSYGTVIANLFAAAGLDTAVYMCSGNSRTTEQDLQNRAKDFNEQYKPIHNQVSGAGPIHATADLEEAIYNRGLVVYAAPSAGLTAMANRIKVSEGTNVVSVAKGLCISNWQPGSTEELLAGPHNPDEVTVHTPLQYLRSHSNFKNASSLSMLAGPGFANKIMEGRAFGLTIGCANNKFRKRLFHLLQSTNRRGINQIGDVKVHQTPDPTSLEIMAAMKNVTAIACGVAFACDNPLDVTYMEADTQQLEIVKSQGLNETVWVSKFVSPGKKVRHRYFISNMLGDFNISSTLRSRNALFGAQLVYGQEAGKSPARVLDEFGKTVEGIQGAHAAKLMTDPRDGRDGIEVPLINTVVDILQGVEDPKTIIQSAIHNRWIYASEDQMPEPSDQYNIRPWYAANNR